jgi:hypothetical protein
LLLYRAAEAQSDPDQKSALVVRAFELADTQHLLGLLARTFGEIAAALDVTPDLHDRALLMGRALLFAGRTDAAEHWYALLDPNNPGDQRARAILGSALAFAAPSPGRQGEAQTALDWFADSALASKPPAPPETMARAALVLGLYDTFSLVLPPSAAGVLPTLAHFDWPGVRPAPRTLEQLRQALPDPRRRGEAVMLVLGAIGQFGPGGLAPDATVALVHDLLRLHLQDDAHALAMEALLDFRAAPQTQAQQ